MKIIYYYHIPKCAGTTITRFLKRIAKFQKGEFHNFNYKMNEKFNFVRRELNNLKMIKFLHSLNHKTNELKIIHHHHGFYGIGEIYNILLQQKEKSLKMGNELYFFTCIRDPISYQISRTNYLRNNLQVPNYSFADVISNTKPQNLMSKYYIKNHPLRWNHVDLKQDSFIKLLDIMDKIFTIESLPNLYTWLEEIINPFIFEDESILNLKVNKGIHKILPTDEEYNKLEELNSFDKFFYDYVCSLRK